MLIPYIFPDQHLLRPGAEKILTLAITASGEASIRCADQIAVLIEELTRYVTAMLRDEVDFPVVVEVTVYFCRRIAHPFCGNLPDLILNAVRCSLCYTLPALLHEQKQGNDDGCS